jgi:hypothetical protein
MPMSRLKAAVWQGQNLDFRPTRGSIEDCISVRIAPKPIKALLVLRLEREAGRSATDLGLVDRGDMNKQRQVLAFRSVSTGRKFLDLGKTFGSVLWISSNRWPSTSAGEPQGIRVQSRRRHAVRHKQLLKAGSPGAIDPALGSAAAPRLGGSGHNPVAARCGPGTRDSAAP